MDVAALKAILMRMEELYVAGGAAAAAKDIQRVTQLLEGHEDESVDRFIAETKALLQKPPAARKVSGADQKLVHEHATRLLAADLDQDSFSDALERLDQDSRIGKNDWFAIANRYRNAPTGSTHVYKFKSIREARAAIRDAFIERYEASSKQSIIERITRWAS